MFAINAIIVHRVFAAIVKLRLALQFFAVNADRVVNSRSQERGIGNELSGSRCSEEREQKAVEIDLPHFREPLRKISFLEQKLPKARIFFKNFTAHHKKSPVSRAFAESSASCASERLDVGGGRPFLALGHVERDLLAFLKGLDRKSVV